MLKRLNTKYYIQPNMDLKQQKLTKSEWESIELPVSSDEKEVLELIMRGFHDVNLKYNKHQSLLSYLKVEKSDEMEDYLYNTYFARKIDKIVKKYDCTFIKISTNPKTKIKKADMIRLEKNSVEEIELLKGTIYEHVLLNQVENLLKLKQANGNWEYYYFTLYKLIRNGISQLSRHILQIVNQMLSENEDSVSLFKIVENASAATSSAGSIATIAQPLGMVARSGSSMLSGKYTTDLTPNTPDWMKKLKKKAPNVSR